jgi:putative DNA primase/helicase
LRRAKDAEAVKAFLSSPVDSYRASYARFPEDVPRTCVIVGTTNADEFLSDDTGNRRFWPIRVAQIDIGLVEKQRDQLWAEAVTAFKLGEPWWLTADEENQLTGVHDDHRVRDAWESKVLEWANTWASRFTTGDVLEKALEKPAGQWSRTDEMRVSAILKCAGWIRRTDKARASAKTWRRP